MNGLGSIPRGKTTVRYHDETRVINSGDTFEMRNVDLRVTGAMKESLDYARKVLYPGLPWYQVIAEILELGIKDMAGLAMMDQAGGKE